VTAKESLVSKECAVLKSFEDASPGQTYLGTVVALRPEVLVVTFFGGVRGILPKDKLDDSFVKSGQATVGRLVSMKNLCIILSEPNYPVCFRFFFFRKLKGT